MKHHKSLNRVVLGFSICVIINVTGSHHLSTPLTSNSVQGCLADDAVSAALKTLSLGKYQQQQAAVTELRANATRSPTCRMQVITGLMKAMDQPELDLTGGTPQFFLWHYGTRLLGELKAVEALDLLIANMHLHDGSGFPFNHYPAIGGVIDMGEIALPKLESVLVKHPDRYRRRDAIFCVALIGGKSAHEVLQRAAKVETDPCAISCIQATLKEFENNKRRPYNISDAGRTTWYTTFLCDGN